MKFPERLKEARVHAKITQVALAKMCNVSQGTIANWESGTRTPDLEMFASLAKRLNVSADYLLGITDTDNLSGTANLLASLHDQSKNTYVFVEMLNELNETQQCEILGRMKLMADQEDEYERKENVS